MDGPVAAAGLAELPGAIKRVDDPDAPGRQPRRIVLAFLGQDSVTGPKPPQFRDQEFVRRLVSCLSQLGGVTVGRRGPQRKQSLARGPRKIARECAIASIQNDSTARSVGSGPA